MPFVSRKFVTFYEMVYGFMRVHTSFIEAFSTNELKLMSVLAPRQVVATISGLGSNKSSTGVSLSVPERSESSKRASESKFDVEL